VPKHRIYGIDIDPSIGPADRWATTIEALTFSIGVGHHLPFSAVQPVVSRARHLVDACITFAAWNRLRSQNERVWLFSPDRAALRSKAVRAYISLGEKACDLSSYKLKHRDPWYMVLVLRVWLLGPFASSFT
jgi:hypothetical protein